MEAIIRAWKALVRKAKSVVNSCFFMKLTSNQHVLPTWSQDTSYRQGSVLSGNVATRCLRITSGYQFAVVISHDCDITNAVITKGVMKEPFIELIIAQAFSRMDGNCSQAKNPRLLHLEFVRHNQFCFMELVATEKRTIDKIDLIDSAPDSSFILSDRNRKILERWLAAHYRRHAFPDKLNRRLGQAFEKNFKKSEALCAFHAFSCRNP